MLPAARNVNIARLGAGPLSFHVVIPFETQGKVVQFVRRIVEVSQERLRRSGAGQHRRTIALRKVRRIERDDLRAERRAAAGNDARRDRIVSIRHIVLVKIVGLESQVPVVVELVIVGGPEPLQIIVAPSSIIDGVGNEVRLSRPSSLVQRTPRRTDGKAPGSLGKVVPG